MPTSLATADIAMRKGIAPALTQGFHDIIEPYRPMLGHWLLQMALLLRWTKPDKRGHLPDTFEDDDFLALTGIKAEFTDDEEDGEESPRRRSRRWSYSEAGGVRRVKARLAALDKIRLSPGLPLFVNIDLLGSLIGAGNADKVVLLFAATFDIFPRFRSAISGRCEQVSSQSLSRLIATLSGESESAIARALRDDGPLVSAGIVQVNAGICDLEQKLSLMETLGGLLMTPDMSEAGIADRFLKRAGSPELSAAAFPHLRHDVGALKAYLLQAARGRARGVNVLFHGTPGTGKTELAKVLAAELGLDLFEIDFANESGDPIRGEQRLRAYNLGQKLLAQRENALLLFDEIEDVFHPAQPFWFLFDEDEPEGGQAGGKAWINRTLERNPVPALWVTNNPRLDKAYLRRFGYSVHFPIPPFPVRLEIVRYHMDRFGPDEAWLARIAEHEEMTPGQLERAAQFASIASSDYPHKALDLAEQNLDRSAALLGQRPLSARSRLHTRYDLRYLNIDQDVGRLIAGLQRHPSGAFCFYGHPGTGKSELARHIAEAIGQPLLVRRASDILSKWVGEAEQNIAAMFAEARRQGAVLLLDEADSLLAERMGAQHLWEITQVNEFLTQLEGHDGLFIATTNLMERLDKASLRRFVGKLRFGYLRPEQMLALFSQELDRLGGDARETATVQSELLRLDKLTPGDFAVAARQFALWQEPANAHSLLAILQQECAIKAGGRPIGFIC